MAQHTARTRVAIISAAFFSTAFTVALLSFPGTSAAAERFETPVGFNVSPTGAANFSIPIEVPPGTAGMAPSLSLNYNSQGGNGMLGMGFSLGGLSAIYRCGRTLIQDGVKDTVNYNSNDKYCMDGQRLVVVPNANGVIGAYGANGTEYRTERESFTKVISYGTAGSGPAYFIAWTKAGQIIEFGNTADARIEAQGKADVRAWAVNKISDTVGNYYTVSYIEDNANGDYRPDRINYSGNTATALAPYNSVRFVYKARSDITPLYQAGSVIKTLLLLANVQTYAKVGTTDALVKDYRLGYEQVGPTLYSRLTSVAECVADGTCLNPSQFGWPSVAIDPQAPGYSAPVIPANIGGYASYHVGAQYMQIGDFNGDGKMDYMWIPNNQTFWNVAYSTGNGFIIVQNVIPANIGGYASYHVGAQYMKFGDFNGDGKMDYMWIPNNQTFWNVAYSTGNGFIIVQNVIPANIGGYASYHVGAQYMQIGDFNGDGKTDYMWIPNNQTFWNVAYSTGNGFTIVQNVIPANIGGYASYHVGAQYMKFGDFNGDGKIDYMWIPNNQTFWLAAYSTPNNMLATTLTTSLGTTTSLAYKPLTDNTIYTKGSGAVYPYMNLQAPLYVVSSATIPNGIGGTRSTNYFYTNAQAHLTGGGFLGFAQVNATDSATGIKTSTAYRQDYPYQGLPLSVTQTQPNGSVLKRVTNTWSFAAYGDTVLPITANGSKHHFPWVASNVEQTYDVTNGISPVTTVTTNTSYDTAYGNATSISTTTGDGYSKTIGNTYDAPDLNKWFLNRLIRSSVTSTIPGGSSLTRTSAFSYATTTGLLLTETIEPDNASLRLDTTYTYDGYGNKKTATVSGTGIVSRSSSTSYDAQGRFPISAANALGHTESRVFDAKFGTVTQVTGPNGLASNFAFDVWGRPTTESGPDGVVTTYTRGLCPASGCPTLAAYYVTVSKPGTSPVTAYFDKFNREQRTQITGFDGRLIRKDTEYDNLGRVKSISRPYYAGDMILYTNYGYDLLNRTTSETDAQGKTTYVDYYGLQSTRTNALGQKRITVNNSQGQLLSVTDALNSVIRYTYDPFGNLLTTTDPANNVTRLKYDQRGRKTGMSDRDMGVWSYSYNVLGELITQRDAKLQVTTNTYDILGRMTRRAEADLITHWTYDTASKGIGKLATTATDNGQTRNFIYDTLGRLTTTSTTIGTTTLAVSTGYDSLGRMDTQTDPAGIKVQNIYNANGYLSQVRNAQTLQVYWTATALSADGQLTNGTFGNNVSETRTIDTLGRTTAVNATHTLGTVTALSYVYDALSNLRTRTDTTQSLTENFGYDALNRLISVTSSNANQAAKSVQYDSLGNITYKSDTGNYAYNPSGAGSVRPHAVASITGRWNTSNQYDANGNIISGGERTYNSTSYNLPYTITRTLNGRTVTTAFLYGADHERVQQSEADGRVTLILNPRLDLGAHYEQTTYPNGVVEKTSYLYAGNRPIGTYSTNAQGINGNNTLRYFHVDAQGSIVAITSGDTANAGAVVERLSYDAWGKRRNPNGTDDVSNNLKGINTDHGYTGHTMLDDVGLIHMNGRVYDPRMGRFLQADPYIQAPGSLQSFNRYSYVLNNPFMYTDPSGYSWLGERWEDLTGSSWSESRDQYVKPVVAIAIAYFTGYYVEGFYGATAGAIAGGAAGGASMAAMYGGTPEQILKGAAIGAATAWAFNGVGTKWPSGMSNVAAHAAVGCASTMASGGSCRSGAIAAAAGSAWTQGTNGASFGFEGDLIAHAVVGGTASQLSGGKFANGAVTAAFGYLFNYCMHNGCTPTDTGTLRGSDNYGSGSFGASRGMRGHAGQDFVASPGEEIVAPISGQVRLAYPYAGNTALTGVAISGNNGEVAKVFYMSPKDGIIGSYVSAGQPIGTAQSLQIKYPNGMTNHVHVGISIQGNPQPLLNYIQGGR